jgi:hypothetical protein
MLWERLIGPKSAEAAILRRFMQEAIGHELRARCESPLEFPSDLRSFVEKIDEQHEQIVNRKAR